MPSKHTQVKVQLTFEHAMKAQTVSRDDSTLSLTSVLDGSGWSTLCALRPGKRSRCPLYRGLGGPQGWSGQVLKISLPSGFDPRTVQPAASRHTDNAYSGPSKNTYESLTVRFPAGARHSLPTRPDRQWGPPNLLRGYHGPFAGGTVAWAWNLPLTNVWIHTSAPPHSIVVCTIGVGFALRNISQQFQNNY